VSWCFPDERDRASRDVLDTLRDKTAIVPALWFLEVSNALLSGERKGRLTHSETAEALQVLCRLPVQVDDRSGMGYAHDIMAVARQHSLTAYDATYLELAIRLSLPLATFDRHLQSAARKAGVRLLVRK
jgi:predicted nucleic acid-binding protein